MHIWSKVHVIHHIVETRFRLISNMRLYLWYDCNAINWISIHIILCQHRLHFSSLNQRLTTCFKACWHRISSNHTRRNRYILISCFRFMNTSQTLNLIIRILTCNIWLLIKNIQIFIRLWLFCFCTIVLAKGRSNFFVTRQLIKILHSFLVLGLKLGVYTSLSFTFTFQ